MRVGKAWERVRPFLEILKLKGSAIDISIVLAVSVFAGGIDGKVLWIILAGILVHSGCDVINDIYDREIDRLCKPKAPIPSGKMSVRAAWAYMVVLFSTSLGIAFSMGKVMFICFLLGIILGGIGYSHPRIRFKDVPVVATAITAFGFALEALGAWSVYSTVDGEAVRFASYIFFLTFSLVLLKDFRDVDGDVSSLPIKLGIRRAAILCCATLMIPLGVLVWLSVFYSSIIMVVVAMTYMVTILPIVKLLLLKDPVSQGSRLKDHMFVAVTTPNFVLSLSPVTT